MRAACCCVMVLAGCAETVDPVQCSSGRTAGTSESEDMTPGEACNACHAFTNAGGEGEAPIYAFAGTVFLTKHEPDDCVGGGGSSDVAHIEIVDKTGRRFKTPITAAGNFMLESRDVKFPVTARVTYRGRTRWMIEPQLSGDCNTCHTAEGGSGASGRIRLP